MAAWLLPLGSTTTWPLRGSIAFSTLPEQVAAPLLQPGT